MNTTGLVPTRVWDLPTRLFHWALVFAVGAAYVSAKVGGNAMVWHQRFGYAVLALLAFRVLWGMWGGHWSRFVQFIYSPATVLRYVGGKAGHIAHLDVGHSPSGALAVFAMLGGLATQAGTGLFSDDDLSNAGPLARFVSDALSSALTGWHSSWGQWLLVGLVALHLCAITYYTQVKRRTLVTPMLDGDKLLPPGTPASADTRRTRWMALLMLAGCCLGTAYLASL